MFDVFGQALADLGDVDGRNIIIEARFADGQYERCPGLAAELVNLKVDVIAVQGAITVREIKKVVANTPTVFAIVVDPVAEDVVADLKHPGGNLTGIVENSQLNYLSAVSPRSAAPRPAGISKRKRGLAD
jgi:putative ABC transport system substrate-binding protein